MIGTQIEEVLIRGGVIDENGAGSGVAFGSVKNSIDGGKRRRRSLAPLLV
jgi:hypothetical protein